MKKDSSKSAFRIHRSEALHWVGNGFPVRSVFGYNDLGQELSPFLLLDYAAPYNFPPGNERRGVEAHPHRGFETVTVAYQGEIEHRDSSGGGGKIGPGDVQWMTAASGLVHEEFHSADFVRSGGMFEMIQLWVNLPAKDKSAKPRYQTLLNADIPRVMLADSDGELRVIAGSFGNKTGPAKTFTPINLWDISLNPGKPFEIPLPAGHSKAFLIRRGSLSIENSQAQAGDLVIIEEAAQQIEIQAREPSSIFLMTGEPLREPVVGYGPFVMNSDAEIKQAFEDFRAGKFGTF